MCSRPSLPLLLLFLLLAAVAAVAVSSVRGDSATYDENTHLSYGRRAIDEGTLARTKGSWDATMPVSILNAWAAGPVEEEGGRSARLFRARLPTVGLLLVLVVVAFAWARELFGPWAGLAAAALTGFSPNLLAHGRLVTTDVPLTLGMVGATWLFWRWWRAPSRPRLALAAFGFGLAQLAKVTAIFLLPIFVLLVGLAALAAWRRQERLEARRLALRGVGGLAALCLGAVLVVNAGFGFEGFGQSLAESSFRSERLQALRKLPVLGSLPLPAPLPWVQGVDLVSKDMARDRWTYCLGEYSPRGFWYYYLVGFFLKEPPALFLLLGLAGWLAASGRLRAAGSEAFLWLPVVFLGVYLSFFYQYQIGLRHLLPAFPFLFVAASRVVAWVPALRPARFAGWVLVGLYAASSLAIHPHYLAYFNAFGGGPMAGSKYLIDSNLDWGQDRARALHVYAPASPVPLAIHPKKPVAGRILVSVNQLVGLKPAQAERYRWLRENFEPVDHVGYSWLVYDVSPAELARCCGAEVAQ